MTQIHIQYVLLNCKKIINNIILKKYIIEEKNHENELLKLSRDKAHHWHDACALFWLSETDEKRCWCDVNKWMRNDYHYLAEEFSQDKRYTEEIT